ncbi:hypothetical protein L195_g011134, partial [Trifolium pratense]
LATHTFRGCKVEIFFAFLVLCSHLPSFTSSGSVRFFHCNCNLQQQPKMEKALTKVTSLKVGLGDSWITKKAKQEFSNISQDINTFSSTVEEKAKWIFNKLKGKPQKSLPDLLREYNLPAGLFPQNIICYEFDEIKGKLIVYLPSACEVSFKDSSVLRYSTRVKGVLTRGKLSAIDGMKTKVLVWVKVTSVTVEGYKSDKIWVTAGVKKSRPKDAYDTPHDALRVSEF